MSTRVWSLEPGDFIEAVAACCHQPIAHVRGLVSRVTKMASGSSPVPHEDPGVCSACGRAQYQVEVSELRDPVRVCARTEFRVIVHWGNVALFPTARKQGENGSKEEGPRKEKEEDDGA